MIKGIGTDIIEIERIEGAINRHGQPFLDRLFTPHEQAYCRKHAHASRHFAGRFAAKEAIAKALGTGFGEALGWLDLEIGNDAQGKPIVELSPQLAARHPNCRLHISISHNQSNATATAILESL